MKELIYKPDIYEGKDPYIFASFHPDDRERVLKILEKLDNRGFRFWMQDGITPGMEADEIIAEHIENCDFFIAFVSRSYLGLLDTVDELNYSRDVNKEYLLIYLEDISLPSGLDMRFTRAQNIRAYSMSIENVYAQLLGIDGANRFYGITDIRFRESAEKIFDKLEKLYPEHKVFALDAVGKHISREIADLYVRAAYPSAERLMLDYGFVTVSTEDARQLRSSVLYPPGFEPETVKPRIDFIMETLAKDYPGKKITDALSKSHKSIHTSLLGLSVWLGYASAADMLNAYGFTGFSSAGGRIAVNPVEVMQQLQQRYDGKKKASGLTDLIHNNPDMKASLKTLSNRSQELFGMSFLQYLKKTGLVVPAEREEKTSSLLINSGKILEDIRALYKEPGFSYGSYDEAAETADRLIVRKNKNGQIYVTDCSFCNETMNIPYGINFIHKEAFAGQSGLVTLILPPTVTEIREGAFSDCDGLESVVFSEGLERIGNNAFSGCTSLKKVIFPKSLKAIGNEAFSGCEELTEAEFKNQRVNVQSDAFDGCLYKLENLQEEGASPAEYFALAVDKNNKAKITAYTGTEEIVVIPGMIAGHPVSSIEKGAFKENGFVREVYISDQIGAINGDVFKDCRNLVKVHLPESVTKLTGAVFSGCTNLSEVNIPDCMEDVQRGLFKDSPLTTLYIGKGTKNIDPDAFCKGDADFTTGLYFKKKSMENLIVNPDNETFRAEETMLLSRDGRILIAEMGDPVKAFIPEGVEEIAPKAYDRLSSLCEVSFPSTLKKIGEKAFSGTNLRSVELPEALETIEIQAFSFCRSLTELDINEGLLTIGPQAFEGCPIEDVYIPASVESIGNNSFFAISTFQGEKPQKFRVDMANVHIIADGVALYQKAGNELTLIKAYHPGLHSMPGGEEQEPLAYEVMDGTSIISAHAFARCSNLKSIVLPEGVKSIGDMAFWDCSKLTEIHIPASCTELSPKAFFGIEINMI